MRLSDKMIVSPSNNSHDIDPQIVAVRENSKMRDQGNPGPLQYSSRIRLA